MLLYSKTLLLQSNFSLKKKVVLGLHYLCVAYSFSSCTLFQRSQLANSVVSYHVMSNHVTRNQATCVCMSRCQPQPQLLVDHSTIHWGAGIHHYNVTSTIFLRAGPECPLHSLKFCHISICTLCNYERLWFLDAKYSWHLELIPLICYHFIQWITLNTTVIYPETFNLSINDTNYMKEHYKRRQWFSFGMLLTVLTQHFKVGQ